MFCVSFWHSVTFKVITTFPFFVILLLPFTFTSTRFLNSSEGWVDHDEGGREGRPRHEDRGHQGEEDVRGGSADEHQADPCAAPCGLRLPHWELRPPQGCPRERDWGLEERQVCVVRRQLRIGVCRGRILQCWRLFAVLMELFFLFENEKRARMF